jgi:probable F420-dependent oxidoreductase
MRIDTISNGPLASAAESAREAEAAGYDGVIWPEIAHDPFLPVALGAAATERIELFTGIAVAFARNPMSVAVTANDLHRLSGGRFVLGLGSQIKPHITKRYSMPWSRPADRMREFVLAVRAIWSSWEQSTPPRFEGEFYTHTLMTPMFDQGPSEHGTPKVFVAAVGPGMTRVAGEVADGLMAHGFTTPEYLRDVTMTNLATGLAAAGRDRSEVEVTLPLLTVVDGPDVEQSMRATRMQLGFYGSTPAYRPVLEHHGWGDLGDELNRLSKAGDWEAMGRAIDDEVVETFAIVSDRDGVAAAVEERFGGLVDRVQTGLEAAVVSDS